MNGFLLIHGNAVFRLKDLKFFEHHLKPLPVLSPIDTVRAGAQNFYARFRKGNGKVQGGLTAELNNNPDRLFLLHDVQYVFPGERLEIEPIRSIIIGAHGFRIAVHHNAFNAHLPKGQRGMNAAVIKLDALADAVGPTAQDDHLFLPGGSNLVFLLIGGIVVRGIGLKLGGAGIHQLVDRFHALCFPDLPNLLLGGIKNFGKLNI